MNWLEKVKEKIQDTAQEVKVQNDDQDQDINDESTDEGDQYEGGPFFKLMNNKMVSVPLKDDYYDQACFFIGSGPSAGDMDLGLLDKAGFLTMGINNSSSIYRPNMHVSVDSAARFLESVWRDPKIMKFSGIGKPNHKIWNHDEWFKNGCPMTNDFYSKTKVRDCPNIVYFTRNNKFDPEKFLTERVINWGNHKNQGGGRSVMIAAIKILYMLGIRRVYLLGTDFTMEGKKPYGFNEQRTSGAVRNNNDGYHKMMSYFTQLGPHFKNAGYEIYQCTPKTALTLFPYISLEDAVAKETSRLPDPSKECTYGMYIPKR
jgi:hypothetical protein